MSRSMVEEPNIYIEEWFDNPIYDWIVGEPNISTEEL